VSAPSDDADTKAQVPPEDARATYISKFTEHGRSLLRETHSFARFSQEHSDKMLTWAIGLMGAGLAAVYPLLARVPWNWRCAVLSPWVLGILTALAGRILGAECRNRNDVYYSAMMSAFGLAQLETNPEIVKKMLGELLSKTGTETATLKARTDVSMRWANSLYYATHILFGLGVLGVAGALAVVGPVTHP